MSDISFNKDKKNYGRRSDTPLNFYSGATILSDGGAKITERGVCWSTSPNPTIADSKTMDGAGIGSFTTILTSLTGSSYYYRAYAINSTGTTYGNELHYTLYDVGVSKIVSPYDTVIYGSTINVTVIIKNYGNSPVSSIPVSYQRGSLTPQNYTWSGTALNLGDTATLSFPTTLTVPDGSGFPLGVFTTLANDAISSNNKINKTIIIAQTPILVDITPNVVTSITASTAIFGGEITDDKNAPITARGVCWSTSPNPTIINTHTLDGTGLGSFTSNITGLIGGTTYYVRAYATNFAGTVYGNEVSFTTTAAPITTVTDYDGNAYDTVQIGTQVWLKQNLKTTHYKNGTTIAYPGTDNTAWQNNNSGAYAWYNNDEATYKNTYGALYNWYAVNTGNLCPTGWHVPTDAEWTTLTNYLGGENIAGGKLKEAGLAHWLNPNASATNETGFTALPGGNRFYNGTYVEVGHGGVWWSSTEYGVPSAWYRGMNYLSGGVYRNYYPKYIGFSVRCLRD